MLTGPHSALQVTSVATVSRLGGAAACALDLPRPQNAAPGYQLLAALVNFNVSGWLLECQLQANVSACLNYPQPQIVIGGSKPRAEQVASLFVISVPDRAPVWLDMNDGGPPPGHRPAHRAAHPRGHQPVLPGPPGLHGNAGAHDLVERD